MEPLAQDEKLMRNYFHIVDIFDTFLQWPFFYLHPRRVELPILPVEQVIQS